MKKSLFFLATILVLGISSNAQNTFPATGPVGIGTTSPNTKSLLEVRSTTKGVLFPRMTTAQRNAIGAPPVGLLIFQTDGTSGFYYYTGSAWKAVTTALGVNKTLSNLTAPTAVNVSLLPGATGTLDLGSSSKKWRDGNFNGTVYANGTSSGIGVEGLGSSYGVYGNSSYLGVYGVGGTYGLYGSSASYYGVYGTGGTYGVWGNSSNIGAYGQGGTYGVYGTGSSYGVYGTSSSYYGVYGNGGTYGVWGNSSYLGVYGVGDSYGLYGSSGSYIGAYASGPTYGVYGYSGTNVGVYGYTGGGGTDESGVYGYCASYGYGLRGYSANGSGVYAQGAAYGGYFNGNVYTTGVYSSSDASLKQNISDFTSAMDIINKLKPKQYNFRQDGNYKLMNLPAGKHYGLISQDVEQVLPNLVKQTTFDPDMAKPQKPVSGVDGKKADDAQTAKSDPINFKALNYTELIPIIIKGMQELSKENADLKDQVAQLKQMISQNTSGAAATSLSGASLGQNFPNPFNKSTVISFSIPKENNSASIVVSQTGTGKILKSIPVSGASQVTLDAASLSAGAYTYTLYIDNKKIDSKQMVISK